MATDRSKNARQLKPGEAAAYLSNRGGRASTVGSEVFCKIGDKRVFFKKELKTLSQEVVARAFNPSTPEAVTGGSL